MTNASRNDSGSETLRSTSDDEQRLSTIVRRFEKFAAAYPRHPLYGAISRGAAGDREVAGMLLAAAPGQERPVLLFAALHDLVLRLGPEGTPAARWYASMVGRDGLPAPELWTAPDAGPWPDVRRTLMDHREEITATIASRSTQTNEVNRSVYVLAMLALAGADVVEREPATAAAVAGEGEPLPLPVVLVELGCSAGLLLTPDRYDVTVTGARTLRWGDPDSAVRLSGEDRTPADHVPLAARRVSSPPIVARVGLDLDPVFPGDSDELRWLEACLWPDVPGRVERFEAAVAQRHAAPEEVELLTGDIADPMALTKALQAAVRLAERAGHAAVTFGPPGGSASHSALPGSGGGVEEAGVDGPGSNEAGADPPVVEEAGVEARATEELGTEELAAGEAGVERTGAAPRGQTTFAMPAVSPALHVVVLSSWTTTYVERSERERVASVLGGFAASTGLPVTWCGAEPAGSMPGRGRFRRSWRPPRPRAPPCSRPVGGAAGASNFRWRGA